MDHGALEMEAAIAHVDHGVNRRVEPRRRAAQDLALGQGQRLGRNDIKRFFGVGFQTGPHAVDGGVELDGAEAGDVGAAVEVLFEGVGQVGFVDVDGHENVENLDLGDVDGHKTQVRVVDDEVAVERPGRVVVDAAGAVRHVAHDNGLNLAKLLQNVRNHQRVNEKPFGHLERHARRAVLADVPHALVDLKVVVGRQKLDAFVEVWVVQNVLGDLVEHTAHGTALRRKRSPQCCGSPAAHETAFFLGFFRFSGLGRRHGQEKWVRWSL